ncbi:MAG: UDP-3-O-(3-hydroxymyristoyl)glucosamine N-acyltransferase [Gemmatimonadota bacterium]
MNPQAVADLVGGRLVGSGSIRLTGVRSLESAGPADLSFLVSARYLSYFRASKAGAVVVDEASATEAAGPQVRIVVADVSSAVEKLLLHFHPPLVAVPGIHSSAILGRGVVLGPDVSIGPQVVVGANSRLGARAVLEAGVVLGDSVIIGDDCQLDARVICYAGTVLGNRVLLKAGAVIGGRGFGYDSDGSGHTALQHVGRAVLEDDVEVGSGSCIDRGRLDDTIIGRGTKLDNLVHIGHNCRLGEHCLIMAGVLLAGSVRLGDGVIAAGGTGIRDHARIGTGVRIAAMSGVFGDVAAGLTIGGYPARPQRDFLKAQAAMYSLAPHAKALINLLAERGVDGPSND